ncbi:MAG TPA: hypothetical protein ENH19_02975 [Actinobacteria bacterium]|nr:hypothetical protein [Actinomycetes bacterium]HEX21598.1 hypothetical protein [Actinomycetota bacterium]
MFGTLKYFFLYCYEAAETMEKKSSEFAEERHKRMEKFRQEHQEMEDRAKEKINDTRDRIKEQMQETVKDIGLITQTEANEIKKMIADLSKRVDKIGKK